MAQKIGDLLQHHSSDATLHNICCRHDPQLESGSVVVNVCAGCDRRFSTLYAGITTISLWQVIDGLDSFAFPDYQGYTMSLHDPCPVRDKPQVHQAVRSILQKMNIVTKVYRQPLTKRC